MRRKKVALEQAEIDRLKSESNAATTVTTARGEATARVALAKASAEENRASAANITTNQVMMHAYDALGKLGGTGTTFLLGDYSKLPGWLFPRMNEFQTAPMYMMPGAPALPSSGEPGVKPTLYNPRDAERNSHLVAPPLRTWGAPRGVRG